MVFLALFSPFSHPHITRQLDSLGIAARYWLRWTATEETAFALLPSLLQAGDHLGIHATEFPLIYVLMAPLFSLAAPFGVIASNFFFLSLSLFATYGCYLTYKKRSDFLSADLAKVFMGIMLFGVGAQYFFRAMPDYLSFILALWGMGFVYAENKWVRGTLLLSLGLLTKPTAVIVAPVALLMDRKSFWRMVKVFILPTVLTLIYYTWGTKNLNFLSDIPRYFYSDFRNPLFQLYEFFANIQKFPRLLLTNIFQFYTFIPLIIFLIFSPKNKRKFRMPLLVLGIQVLMAAGLDGNHFYIHDYYIIASSFTVSYLIVLLLGELNQKKAFFVLLLVFIGTLEKGFYATRKIFDFENQLVQIFGISEYLGSERKIRSSEMFFQHTGSYLQRTYNSTSARFGVYHRKKDKLPKGLSPVFTTRDYNIYDFNPDASRE